MENCINLSGSEKAFIAVDPSKVTGLQYLEHKDGCHLAIFTDSNRMADVYDLKTFETDLPTVLQQLTDAGFPLTSLPNDNAQQKVFVSPKHIVYATASVPNEKNEGKLHFIIGVTGMGRYECDSGVEPKAFADLMQAVTAEKPMRSYTSRLASARFMRPDQLFIDPSAIRLIKENGGIDFWIHFTNAGSLDVQVGNVMPPSQGDIACDIMNKKDNTLTLSEAFELAKPIKQAKEVEQHNVRMLFAGDLARQNKQLVLLSSERQINCLRPQDIMQAKQEPNKDTFDLEIHVNTGTQYPEFVRLNYATEEACKAAYAKLSPAAKPQTPKI